MPRSTPGSRRSLARGGANRARLAEELDSWEHERQAALVRSRGISMGYVGLGAVGALFVAVMAGLVLAPISRSDVPGYDPEVNAVVATTGLVGPVVYTIDGRAQDAWRFFQFRGGSAVSDPGAMDWDLAVRRHRLIVNGGAGFAGRGGIVVIRALPYDSVREAPQGGYLTTSASADSAVPGLKWYSYGFSSHILTPKGDVYALRTADDRYAKFEILSYYCTGAQPGCLTIRYTYQTDGSRRFGAEVITSTP